jgi:hypothetical protein
MDGLVPKKQYNKKKIYKNIRESTKGAVIVNDKKNNFLYQVYQLGEAYDSDDLTIGQTSFFDEQENFNNTKEEIVVDSEIENIQETSEVNGEISYEFFNEVCNNDYFDLGLQDESLNIDKEQIDVQEKNFQQLQENTDFKEGDVFESENIYEDSSLNDTFEIAETQNDFEQTYESEEDDEEDEDTFSLKDVPIFTQKSALLSKGISFRFASVIGIVTMTLGLFLFVGTSLAVKNRVENAPKRAIYSIKSAMYSISEDDFSSSSKDIDNAYKEFLFASTEMNKIGDIATFVSQFIPGASKLSSGSHLIEAGKYLTHSAQELHDVIPEIIKNDNSLIAQDGVSLSFLELYRLIADKMDVVYEDIKLAREHLDKVYIDDVPEEYQDSFLQMRDLIPEVEQSIKTTIGARSAIEEILGANGKRTYLFLFQNNHEMRATGGFIGSYGILKMNNGQIEKLVVDDIFNPDGQLIDRIVPPLPIQKISANWSLHDSNWFVDFPVSAKKAIDFYERTGGPTVDGVIAITPAMMQKFLVITGPIALPQYDMILTSDNFMEIMQSEVEDEENYMQAHANDEQTLESDQSEEQLILVEEQKQPKKVLSDLMPILMEKLSSKRDPESLAKLISAVSSGLKERHIIMYMTDEEVQNIIVDKGWSGTVLQTDRDYLSVINTNINGFKTDGVVDEEIVHTAEIDKNGYIIDTVEIKRMHKGGKTGFPWWDAVNSDYMRIYVPKGSEFISVEGQTREINKERLDYDKLGYERDVDVEKEENNINIDEETGTRIYDEYGKTVFANWVYVSPQESVVVKYKYRLPFQVKFESDNEGKFGSYAVLFQKQSGSENSTIKSNVELSDDFVSVWTSQDKEESTMNNNLKTDRYNGVVFRVR